jgi:glucose/arabinose dehydrogenase
VLLGNNKGEAVKEISTRRSAVLFVALLAGLGSATLAAAGAALPPGFMETRIASGMTNVTTMAIAPDGRVFVSEQGVVNNATPGKGTGNLRVIKNNALLPTPALSLTVDPTNERGMLGIAFDPAFATNQYIYLYYTVPQASFDPLLPNLGAHNRISRFTMSGDVAIPSSELVLLDLPLLGTAPIHNSGSLHFGPDGKLYVSVGENFRAPNAQDLTVPLGKLLRINSDGTIPSDNPFVGTPGAHPAIYAYGLRNPFTFDIQPGTGRILVNDVGDKLFDEINDIVPGGNYGWGDTEGPHNDPRFLQPFYYRAWSAADCTLIGAAFYDPAVRNFPASFVGKYFFSDLCAGYIKVLDPATATVETFVPSGLVTPVDLDVSADGKLYYLNRGAGNLTGEVYKIEVSDGRPHISVPPASQLITAGNTVTFSCSANGFEPLTFEWFRDGASVAGPAAGTNGSSSYSVPVGTADSGAKFRCKAANDYGSEESADATLTVTSNQTPIASIMAPDTYRGGDTISFSGQATDNEDGALPASAFSWEVLLDHETHSHPATIVNGSMSGSYLVPRVGEQSSHVKYRIILRVTDSTGLVRVVEHNVLPVLSSLTVASSPSGREVKLDGQPKTAPLTVEAVSGMTRTLDVEAWQHLSEGGPTSQASTTWYQFQNWSDGGAQAHTITAPDGSATYSANFNTLVSPECITFPTFARFLNAPFANQTGQFSMEFDVTPVSTTSPLVNVTIGFSDGPRGGLPGQAGAIIFTAPATGPGKIQARGFTGGEPAAGVAPPYTVGQTYHFRLEVNITTHTYDAYYTAPGQPEALLQAGLRFRVEHQFITQLNNWGVFASRIASDPSATVKVCRFRLNCSNAKNTAPVVTPPPDVTVYTGPGTTACSKVVTDAELGTGSATDNCTFTLTRSGVPAGNVFPKGVTLITYSATDGGGLTGTATQKVTVVDNTPPTIGGISAAPTVLWPPNHKMVLVTVNYTTADNCGPATGSLSVTSDQPLGIFTPDWEIVDAHHVKLRAERSIIPALFGQGRTYTITIKATDGAGNVTTQTVPVKVPAWNHTHALVGCKNSDHSFDTIGD